MQSASDNAQFMQPALVIRFPSPDVEKSVVVGCHSYLTKHRNIIELYSCTASESRKFFKRVFYLKQINFITGGPLAAGDGGNCPRKLIIISYTTMEEFGRTKNYYNLSLICYFHKKSLSHSWEREFFVGLDKIF